jgi:hypothetical protein
MKIKKYVVDRFENGYAVLEDIETMKTSSRPVSELPEGVREGDAIDETDGVLMINKAETERRARSARERFNRLRKN